MKVDVFNMEGEKLANQVELPAAIFEAAINKDLMHQAFIRQMANARLGTHDTKVRGEVAGGGKKPWKQKGTGRARQGSTLCCPVGRWWSYFYATSAQVYATYAFKDAPSSYSFGSFGQSC